MISYFFKDLLQIQGMEAIIVYSKNNIILDSWTISNFNQKILNDLGLFYQQIFTLCKMFSQPHQEIVLVYDKRKIYGKKYKDLLILIVAKSKVNIAMLRLIINVGFYELDHSKKFQKILKKIHTSEFNYFDKKYLDNVEQKFLNKLITK